MATYAPLRASTAMPTGAASSPPATAAYRRLVETGPRQHIPWGASSAERSWALGVFEFIIVLVVISTAGKVLSRRYSRRDLPGGEPRVAPRELEGIRESVDNLGHRLQLLEEERDFYKELLDSPRRRELPSPDVANQAPDDDRG